MSPELATKPKTEPSMHEVPQPEAAKTRQDANEELLKTSEIGTFMVDAYRTAVDLDPRMAEVAIVPIENSDDPRHGYASAKESKTNVTGQHEVHIRLDNLDGILAKYEEAKTAAPEAIDIIAKQMGVSAEEVTPQALYIQSFLHELGHLTEHMDDEEAGDPRRGIELRKREMAALPLGSVAVSKLRSPNTEQGKLFAEQWETLARQHGVETQDELIAMQSIGYRNLTSERIADNFAADAFAINPQLLDQMMHGNLDEYRSAHAMQQQIEVENRVAQEQLSDKEETVLGTVNRPETRRYTAGEEYRFLTHATLDNPERTFNYLGAGDEFRIESDKPLNTSLLDQAHTATFEGSSGFIIRPPEEAKDVTGVWTGDVGVDLENHNQGTNMNADELMEATKVDGYNQVHVKSGKVEGVFMRVAADTGEPLGSAETNKALLALAERHDLPVAQIMVEPRVITETTPSFDGPQDNGSGELYQLVIPQNGHEYKVDIIKQAQDGDVSFVDENGFAMRMAKVDGYDVWDRDLESADLDLIQAGIKKLPLAFDVRQYLDKQLAAARASRESA